MIASRLFRFGTLLFVLTMAMVAMSFGQTYYLNVTDGADSYSGANPTNSPVGTGPKRTFEGVRDAANLLTAGTAVTINVAAGTYDINQSGIGGGNDADGVSITGDRNFTFVIQTFNALTTVTIPEGLTLNVSSGRTVAFRAQDAGVQGLTLGKSGGVATILDLTVGTLDVSGLGSFTVLTGTTIPQIKRSAGILSGTPTFSGNYNVTYSGSSKTAGPELPASLGTGSLTVNLSAATNSVTISSALSVTTGGISFTQGGGSFSALVTLTPGTGASLGIANSGGGAASFAGGINVSSRGTGAPVTNALGNLIVNSGAGSIAVSGALTLTNSTTSASTAYGDVTATITNTSTGTVNVSGVMSQVKGAFSSTVSYDFVVSASNTSSGTLSIGSSSGASTLNGTLTNGSTGTVNINGASTVSGNVTNDTGGRINVNAAATIAGALSSNNASSVVALSGNTLTLSGTATHTNAGSISSSSVGTGEIVFTGTGAKTWNGTGSIPNVTNSGSGLVTFASAKTITGNVVSSGSGGITFSAAHTITGALTISSTGTVTANGTLTITGGVSLNGGTLALGTAGATVSGSFSQAGGALSFGGNTLEIKGNFNRTSGTVTPATGKLLFSSGGSQTFNGGANFAVNTLETSGIGTGVTFGSSVIVNGNATLGPNTSVVLGTFNIRMAGNLAIFSLSGSYTSTGGGGVIFEAPSDNQTISGTGIYSNIEVQLGDVTKNVIVANSSTVTFSGALTFTRGGVVVGTTDGGLGTTFLNPSSILVIPSVAVNLGGAPDGKGVNLNIDGGGTNNGAFNANAVSYNLLYFGTLSADRTVGSEFVAGVTPTVINLSVTTTGAFSVLLPDNEYRFSGNLNIAAGATLKIDGTTATKDLVSTANGVTHTIAGTLARTNSSAGFVVNGTGVTMNGGDNSSSAASQGRVTATTIAANASATVSGIREFASTLTNNGTLTLGLATVTGDATSGQVTGTYTGAGDLTLAANATFAGTVTHNSGAINLVSYNLTYSGASYTRAVGTAATYTNAPTSTSNGFLKFTTSATVNLNTGTVPRVEVNGAGITVTLGGSATVSDRFVQTAGTAVDLGANTLTISGSVWTFTAGGFAGTGTVAITGNTTLTAAASFTVPNLTVNTDSSFTVASSSSTTARTLTVSTLLTQTKGTIALGFNDIALTAAAGNAYTYTAGTVTATSSSSLTATIGEIIFNPLAGNTSNLNLTASGWSVPNLTVSTGTMAVVAGTTTFTVTNRLTFGEGSATGLATGGGAARLTMADNSWIVRGGALSGTLSSAPALAGVVNVAYTATASISSGVELPTSATGLKDLWVAVGANTLTFTAAASTTPVVLNGTLTLSSGTVTYGTTRPLQVATGATVDVKAGTIDQGATIAAIAPLGAYNLTYSASAGNVTTTSKEWPSTASITTLTVSVGDAATPNDRLANLHASRTVTNFTLSGATALSGLNLHNTGGAGGTSTNLTVTGTTTITAGRVYSLSDANAVFGQLIVQGNVTMTGGSFNTNAQLVFTGTANQTFSLPGNQTVANLTVNKGTATPTPTITLSGGNLTVGTTLTLNNGLLVTGTNAVVLTGNTFNTSNQGFLRNVTGTNKSHIVGAVSVPLKLGNIIAFGRNEFPVGDLTSYRPAALTFVNASLPAGIALGVSATVKYDGTKPTGVVGLPIANGVSQGVDLARYPGFNWSISTTGSLGATVFNAEFTAEGFADFDDVSNVRIIRRNGSLTDVSNQWLLQGAQYDNLVINGVPTVVNVGSQGGLTQGGAIFTYGLKSNMVIANPIANQILPDGGRLKKIKLTNPAVVAGNTGVLTWAVSSSNTAFVEATIVGGDSLQLRGRIATPTGSPVTVTVTATDVDNSRINTTFTVTVTGVTDVDKPELIPTEFGLAQNYPNPFNPSTTIRFSLPKESPVTLDIYNMLGVKVRTLIAGKTMNAAFHTVVWDGKDDAGVTVSSGVYLYRISADKFVSSKKMMMLK